MNPYLNDFLRIMTSKAAILLLTIIILFSFLAGYTTEYPFVTSMPNPANTFYIADNYYSNSTEVHYMTQAFNGYGQSVTGAVVQYQLYVPTTTGRVLRMYNITTGSAGFANLTYMSMPEENMTNFTQVTLLLENSHGEILQTSNSVFLFNHSQLIYGMQVVRNPSNPLHGMVHIVYLGPPSNYSEKVGLYIAGSSGWLGKNLDSSYNYTFITLLSDFTVVNVPIDVNSNDAVSYNIALYNSSGDYIWSTSGPLSFLPSPNAVLTVFYNFISTIMPGFVPLLAVLVGYFYFGKERVDGVLESIIVRPVTRTSVIASRFLASVLLFSIASIIGLAIIDILVGYFTGVYLFGSHFLYAYWGILVMSAGFIGITYLLSFQIRTSGSLIGISVAVYVTLSLMWQYLSLAIESAIGLPFGGKAFIQFYITMLYLSPGGYLPLGGILATGSSPILGNLTHLSAYGLTAPLFLAGGLAWSVVPFFISLICFSRRD